MQRPIDIIEHDGESFHISYEEFMECGDCDEWWEVTAPNDEDEAYRTEPHGETTCPSCGASGGHAYRKRAHYYMKYSAIPLEDPPLDVEPHTEALHRIAREFEALDANGWEIIQSDGVHIDFEKVEIESTDSDYKVTDALE